MKQRKIIAILTLVCFMFTLLPVAAMAEVLNENDGVSETAETEAAEPTVTSGTCGDNLTWELVDGVLTISGSGEIQYNPWRDTIGSITKVIINEGVTAISANAFNSGTAIVEVNFPDSLIEIGANAFYGCSLLKSINLPETLNSIGNAAFYGCEELESVNFPTGLAGISDFAFWGCKSLQNVNFPNALTSIGADSFSGCASFTQISIPENVSSIGKRAFYGCTAIEEIYFFGNVPTFEENFVLDPALEATLYYPADNMTWDFETNGLNVASFGGNYITWVPYDAPEKVVSVELGKTNTTLIVGNTEQLTAKINPDKADNKTVFWESSDDTVVTVNENGLLTAVSVGSAKVKVTTEDGGFVAECEVSVIANENMQSGYCNFYNSEYGKNVYWAYDPKTSVLTLQGEGEIIDFYPDSAYSTPAVFREAKTIIIKEGITSVGSFVFAKNSNLENVCFPSTLKSIHQNAFEFCTKLEILSIPDSVTEIQGNAFSQCLGLKSVDTGDGVTSFSGFSFHDLTQSDLSDGYYSAIQLNNIVIGNSIEEIPENMFRNCGSLTDIIIPDSVVTIGDYAFSNCDGLENVMIPDTVLNLGKGVLAACDNLKAVSLGDGIETINAGVFYNCKQLVTVELGEDATCIEDSYIIDLQEPAGGVFENCISLQSITLPNQLQKIGTEAFKGCTNLEKIELPETVASLGENAFAGCSKLFTISLGSNITEIAPGTFMDCDNLQEIVIQGAVNEIGDSAFKNCISLEMVSWPDKLQTIGKYAFENCKVLKEIVLPDTVTSVGYGAFKDCLGIEKIVLSDNMTTFDGNNICDENTGKLYLLDTGNGIDYVPYLGKRAFEVVETVIIGNSVKNIDNNEFENCINLKELILGNSVNKIGRSAFSGCSALSGVRFPSSVETIENNAFNGCSSLTEIVLPDSVENLGNGAFSGCTAVEKVDTGNGISELAGFDFYDYANLKTVTIGDNVTTIPEKTFKNLTQLNSVTMGENITSIGSNAFENCSSLTAIKIPTGVMELEDSTFSGCTSLSSINIPNGLTNIGVNAFNNCSSLDTITLPDSMEQIGAYAFADCKELSSINIPGGLDSISNGVFSGCSNLKEVKIPDGVTSIGANAFENADSLKIVVLPNSITTISTKAFANSDALISIVVPDSVTLISSTAFTGSNNLTIYGYAGSYAETYAKQEEIPFVALTEGDIPSTEGTIISILSETYELKVGEANAIPLMYGITPDSAKEQDVTWTIADESIIKSVDVPVGGYWIEGLKPGTTTITATTEDGASSTRTILVKDNNVGSNGTTISIYAENLICEVGKELEITAQALYQIPIAERKDIMWVIGDESILKKVEVTNNITEGSSTLSVQGLKDGTTFVTAYTSDGATITKSITVGSGALSDGSNVEGTNGTTIFLGQGNYNCALGYETQIGATVIYPEGMPQNEMLTWSIADKSIAEILTTPPEGCSNTATTVWIRGLKEGSTTISVSTSDGAKTSAVLSVVKTGKIRPVFYSTTGSYSIMEEEMFAVGVGIYQDAIHLQDVSQIEFAVDNSKKISIEDIIMRDGYIFAVIKGLEKGISTLNVTDKRYNIEAQILITVKDEEGYLYTVNSVPEITFKNIWGKEENANFYDFSGMYIDNFTAVDTADKTKKINTMDVYNEQYIYGVVEVYNKEGQIIDCAVINKFNDSTSIKQILVDDVYLLLKELSAGDLLTYQQEVGRKKTTVTVEVPKGGYIRITNNGGESYFAGLLNCVDIAMSAGSVVDNMVSQWNRDISDKACKEIIVQELLNISDKINNKEYIQEKFAKKAFENVAINSEGMGNFAQSAANSVQNTLTSETLIDILGSMGISVTEDIFTKSTSVFGLAIEGILATQKYGNVSFGMLHYSRALHSDVIEIAVPENSKTITIKCPVDVYVYNSEGLLKGKIVNDIVDEEITQIPMWVTEDEKHFVVSDELYTIKLVGNGTGTMDYIVEEFADGQTVSRTIEFLNLPLVEGKEYRGKIEAPVYIDSASYALTADTGETIYRDTDSYEDKPTSTASSGGGFSGKYNYPVNIAEASGADVTSSKNYAVAGEIVTITVDPVSGKQVDEVVVTDADGNIIPVTKAGDNKYSFTMPEGKVNVAVTTENADYDKRIVMQINNKNILVDNRTVTNDVAPVIVGERTMVPIRVVTELLGGTAEWNEDTRTVTLKIDDKVLSMTIDQPIPGFGTSATIINNRTYVPIRYVAEKLGANVEWIQAAQQIVIEK